MPGRQPFGACVSRLEGGTMPRPEAAYHSAEPASGTTARHLACLTASNSDAGAEEAYEETATEIEDFISRLVELAWPENVADNPSRLPH
jgi:hypothetical protein